MNQNNFDVLIDSDAFLGWIMPGDAHFQKVAASFERIEQEGLEVVTTSLVIAETATVLSHKDTQSSAHQFLEYILEKNIRIIHVTPELQEKAYQVFLGVEKKNTSMVDCSNAVVMWEFEIPYIFSFDQVYPKHFNLQFVDSHFQQ